jgi:DNA end-binding protein Ku
MAMARRAAAKRKGRIAPPARPYWTGTIQLSLVSLPVNVFTGVDRAGEVHFHQIHKPTGKRVRYLKVVPGVGEVKPADIVKGYEYEKGHYAIVAPEELKALRLETTNTMPIVRFVDRREIDAIWFDAPFFVAPAEDSAVDAFIVIRDALRAARKIALGQIVLGGRERIAALQPCGRGMLMETLRYPDDIRAKDALFAPIAERKPDKEQLDLAAMLIERKSGPFAPGDFKDHYEQAVRALLEEKKKGHKVVAPEDEAPAGGGAEVIDLMEALRRSVKGAAPAVRAARPGGGKASRARARSRRKAAGGRH